MAENSRIVLGGEETDFPKLLTEDVGLSRSYTFFRLIIAIFCCPYHIEGNIWRSDECRISVTSSDSRRKGKIVISAP